MENKQKGATVFDETDTQDTDYITCPHCAHQYSEHCNFKELLENRMLFHCEKCGQPFLAEMEVSYFTEKQRK